MESVLQEILKEAQEGAPALKTRPEFEAFKAAYVGPKGRLTAQMKLLDKKVLEERLDILLNRVRGLSDAAYQTQVGTVKEVLLESENKGRSSENFWVKTHKSYPVGSIVRTEIEKADGTLLFARD